MRDGAQRGALALQRGERRRERRRRDLAAALADEGGLLELEPDLFQSTFLCVFFCCRASKEKENVSEGQAGARRNKAEEKKKEVGKK